MNNITKFCLKKNLFTKYSSNSFYKLITKNKFRRDIQPGLTRYNWDSLTNDKQPAQVNKNILIFSNQDQLMEQTLRNYLIKYP